jgi:penicillin-binding protein 1B
MSIEITSVPDQRGTRNRNIVIAIALSLMTVACAGDVFIRSYNFYSQIIDARLATGYLTSRPGLYAAPRVLQPGQKFSVEKLVATLRRAGYVESQGSGIWSGSFTANGSVIEIRPNRAGPRVVRVTFDGEHIAELRGDGVAIESFTLEPEILSNDLSSKAGKREILNYNEIPPVLIHAITSIEDHRFFEHSGVDVSGLARAFIRNAERRTVGPGWIDYHAAAGQEYIPHARRKTLQRKYAEAMLSLSLEQAAFQARHPCAVLQRDLPGPTRRSIGSRREGSCARLLRKRTEPDLACGGGDARRNDSESCSLLAGATSEAAQARAKRSAVVDAAERMDFRGTTRVSFSGADRACPGS